MTSLGELPRFSGETDFAQPESTGWGRRGGGGEGGGTLPPHRPLLLSMTLEAGDPEKGIIEAGVLGSVLTLPSPDSGSAHRPLPSPPRRAGRPTTGDYRPRLRGPRAGGASLRSASTRHLRFSALSRVGPRRLPQESVSGYSSLVY